MLTVEERAESYRIASNLRADHGVPAMVHLVATALVEDVDRECKLRDRIRELQDAVERSARVSVENAKNYAANLAAEKRAGAERVECIRAAALAGVGDEKQRELMAEALLVVMGNVETPAMAAYIARAVLAQGKALAEARAMLSDIGERALTLLGKGGT